VDFHYLTSTITSLILILIVGLIVWAILRRREKTTSQPSSKHNLLFIISFLTFLMVYFGLAQVFRIVFELLSGTSTAYEWDLTSRLGNSTRSELALWLSLTIVGAPIFGFIWSRIKKILKTLSGKEALIESSAKNQVSTLAIWLSSLISLLVLVYFVYVALTFLLQVSSYQLSRFSTPIAYLLVSLPTLLYFQREKS